MEFIGKNQKEHSRHVTSQSSSRSLKATTPEFWMVQLAKMVPQGTDD